MTTYSTMGSTRLWAVCFGLAALFLAACNPDQGPEQFSLSGKLTDYPKAPVYLEKVHPKSNTVVDSAMTDEQGAFTISHAA
ncbi:MAG: hypothetical protein U0176_11700 [Bacteroidia bacterium]